MLDKSSANALWQPSIWKFGEQQVVISWKKVSLKWNISQVICKFDGNEYYDTSVWIEGWR